MPEVSAHIKFKNEGGVDGERLKREFEEEIHPKLRSVLFMASWYYHKWLKKRMMVTCLVRTKAENDAVGGWKYSSHLDGKGADIRLKGLSDAQIDHFVSMIDEMFIIDPKAKVERKAVYIKRHGNHIHLNIKESPS